MSLIATWVLAEPVHHEGAQDPRGGQPPPGQHVQARHHQGHGLQHAHGAGQGQLRQGSARREKGIYYFYLFNIDENNYKHSKCNILKIKGSFGKVLLAERKVKKI